MENRSDNTCRQANARLRERNVAEMGVVRYLASHAPIDVSLVGICQLVECSQPSSQCIAVQLVGGAVAFSTASDVPDELLSAVERWMLDDATHFAPDPTDARHTEAPDPTRPSTHTVWRLPIFGLDNRPLGELFVARDSSASSDGAVDTFDQAARLTRLAIEQCQVAEQLAATIAAERELIANELHDDPIQSITVLSLMLQRLGRVLPPELYGEVDAARRKADIAIDRMRRMLFELHPAALDEDGLAVAIEVYLEEAVEPLGIAWTLQDNLDEQPGTSSSTLAFRLTHEAIANAVKHAGASHVAVSLKRENAGLAISVADDAHGFDVSKIRARRPGHLGLANVQLLARGAAGRCQVTSGPGNGAPLTSGSRSIRAADELPILRLVGSRRLQRRRVAAGRVSAGPATGTA